MDVIAVVVSDQHAGERAHLGREQLLAQVGPAIHEQALSVAFDQDGRPEPGVARFVRVAGAPVVADLRNAGRRAAAENADFQEAAPGAARLNRRKKFAVVASAS